VRGFLPVGFISHDMAGDRLGGGHLAGWSSYERLVAVVWKLLRLELLLDQSIRTII
jgi:hypothetical protein